MPTGTWQVKTCDHIDAIDAEDWQALFPATAGPFLRHAFLKALEDSGAVGAESGWHPRHLAVYHAGRLVAALPAYLKTHSYGEYVFDQSWAEAYHRHGLPYYPKLVTAIPFTPVTGPRLGLATGVDRDTLLGVLQGAIDGLLEGQLCSSWHLLFPDRDLGADLERLQAGTLLRREGVQYHWFNRNYRHFDDFLASLSSRRRKTLRKERQNAAAGLTFHWLQGDGITAQALRDFYPFYASTYLCRGQRPYLNSTFFSTLAHVMPEQILLLRVERGSDPVAGALFFHDDTTLYGRYWGCREDLPFLHFETCYYQGIEYCIRHGLRRFDAGAQGEHKLLRGFEPVMTESWHWIRHSGFRQAIARFLEEEQRDVAGYREQAQDYLPYRQEQDSP